MAVIMGIDQSLTSTGICIIDGNTIVRTEVINTTKNNDDFIEDVMARSARIAARIVKLVTFHNVTHVTIESPSLCSVGNATRSLAMLFAVIQHELRKAGFPPLSVPPKTLKKVATGSGNAKKEDMLNAVPAHVMVHLMHAPKTKGRYDLADAYHLATYPRNSTHA